MTSPTGRLSKSEPNITEDGRKIREAFTDAYDYGLDVPPARPVAIEPIKTICRGGPWHGATITHMPDDHKQRATNGGAYEYDSLHKVWQFYATGF